MLRHVVDNCCVVSHYIPINHLWMIPRLRWSYALARTPDWGLPFPLPWRQFGRPWRLLVDPRRQSLLSQRLSVISQRWLFLAFQHLPWLFSYGWNSKILPCVILVVCFEPGHLPNYWLHIVLLNQFVFLLRVRKELLVVFCQLQVFPLVFSKYLLGILTDVHLLVIYFGMG